MRSLLIASLLFPLALLAQDERRVTSPNGQVEFRLFIAQPDDGGLSELAYQVLFRGKVILDTSWLGLDIHNQEPLLGDNLGLIRSSTSVQPLDRSLIAEYMQNGSLGRRINVEVRAYNDGVAFRYIVPRTTTLDEILIDDENTEFSLVHPGPLAEKTFSLPLVTAQPDAGWVAIAQAGDTKPVVLIHGEATGLITHLTGTTRDPNVAWEGVTPLTWPWRIVIFGLDKDHLSQSPVFHDLNH